MTPVEFVYHVFHFIPNNDVIKKFSLNEYAPRINQSYPSSLKVTASTSKKSLRSQSTSVCKTTKTFQIIPKLTKKNKKSFNLMSFDIINVYMLQNECNALKYMCSIWIIFCRTSKQFNAHRQFEKCTFFCCESRQLSQLCSS